ncbi:hypothetical protein EUGRSUZ_B00439 [Eucalyptus grandis]|uniref:Uncharacterized protein n=2 Tax=Eucalyptus grandis TaxID=71139 RepID=A0ACC3LMS2_EUCGR|nr:hypothetical protein EUGRSUZ_B00439 [Eucalyptus grandis]
MACRGTFATSAASLHRIDFQSAVVDALKWIIGNRHQGVGDNNFGHNVRLSTELFMAAGHVSSAKYMRTFLFVCKLIYAFLNKASTL